MTHDLLMQLASQRQAQRTRQADWDRRTAATRPAPQPARRPTVIRPFSAVVARVSRA